MNFPTRPYSCRLRQGVGVVPDTVLNQNNPVIDHLDTPGKALCCCRVRLFQIVKADCFGYDMGRMMGRS